MTVVISTIETLRATLDKALDSVGLVPTMGALHAGHLSLIQQAKQENGCVVVSIFVNPLQFGQGEDYAKYPRNLASDRQICEEAGVDIIFAPAVDQIYGIGEITQVIPPESMTSVLCGRLRLGHFTGLATVVTKLLNIVQPHRIYFGQKDGQQLAIVRRLIRDLNFVTEVVACPTRRSPSGLALSSRNQYLTPDQLVTAASLYQALQVAESAFRAGEVAVNALTSLAQNSLSPDVDLEYVELVDLETLQPLANAKNLSMLAIAARVGGTRLIDNIVLN
ncbi:pantoate--beta-alanine ligase [Synechococcus sp. PCC 7502]|nr:pantoate--beta-alanine ligase [Synechococcus sp. PCC 7502]AFY73214.1 pantoate--beta-alanine ligase [Synechococcus sp. PCC 7502]